MKDASRIVNVMLVKEIVTVIMDVKAHLSASKGLARLKFLVTRQAALVIDLIGITAMIHHRPVITHAGQREQAQ
jgi:hypothetical protein